MLQSPGMFTTLPNYFYIYPSSIVQLGTVTGFSFFQNIDISIWDKKTTNSYQ